MCNSTLAGVCQKLKNIEFEALKCVIITILYEEYVQLTFRHNPVGRSKPQPNTLMFIA